MNNQTIAVTIADFIENHLDEDLPLDKIARELNYSKFHIARTFTEHTGCTIYKYIQGRRLTLAAQKLVQTKKPIVEIAYEAHYNSQQAFTLAFSRLYLCTPKIYRKNGVFLPGQSRIGLNSSASSIHCIASNIILMGGKMAA